MALTDLTRISTSGIATGTSLSGAILHGDAHFRGDQVGINSAIFDSSENQLDFKDNVKLRFGDSADLSLWAAGGASYIHEKGSGQLVIQGSNIILESTGGTDYFYGIDGGTTAICHGGSAKVQTTSTGAIVTGILTATTFSGQAYNTAGIATFYNLRVSNDLTVEGTTTTLDTNLVGVDRIEVGANSNSIVGVAITQSGTADIFNLYDGATEVFSVADGGAITATGTITAASFVGGLPITSGADNRVITASSASAIQGEANLTFDGSTLLQFNGTTDPKIRLQSAESGSKRLDLWVDGGEAIGYIAADQSASQLAFRTTGTERLRITSVGKVGIGTAVPSAGLDLRDDSSDGGFYFKRTNGTIMTQIFGDGTGTNARQLMYSGGAAKIHLNTAGTSYFDGGRFGVGTNAPSFFTEIDASGVLGDVLKIKGSSTGQMVNIQNTGGSSIPSIVRFANHAGNAFWDVTYINSNNNFTLDYNDSVKLTLKSTGKIGIGIDDPDSLLHVHNGSAGSIAASSAANITIESSDSSYNVLQFLSPASAAQQIRFGDPSDNGAGWIQYNHNGNNLAFGTAGPQKMELTSGGLLLLGTDDTGFSTGYTTMTIGNTSTSNTGLTIASSASNGYSRLHFADNTSGSGRYAGWIAYSHSDDTLRVSTANSGSAKLVMNSNGYIGLNETTPDSWLHVQSNDSRGHQRCLELKHPNTTTTGDGPALLLNGYYNGAEWQYAKISSENSGTGYGAKFKIHVHPQNSSQAANLVEGLEITGNGTGADVIIPNNGKLKITSANNGGQTGTLLMIGSQGTGETRAIDIMGSWSTNENKSITWSHGSTNNHMIAQLNVRYYSPGSEMRWGRLYHSGDSSTFTMFLTSISGTLSKLQVNGRIAANSDIGTYVPLSARAYQGNTSALACESGSYNTAFSALPWNAGGTYIASGTYYDNGTWVHRSDGNDNCLFYMRGGGWYWYSSDNGSTGWNVASSTNIMNSTGVWVGGTSSDRRLKDNITNMSSSDALTKVSQLQGVSYTWKDDVQKKFGKGPYPEGTHYGFIAQDVKTVWPEAHIISQIDNESDFDEDPTKDVKDDVYYGEIEGVKLEKMIPLLLEAIKELKKENDALKARVTTLEGS